MKYLVFLLILLMPCMVWGFHPTTDCSSCHIPHGDGGLDGMPLWSGTITTTTVFTNYDSFTLDAAAGDPEGPTLLCLGCHDGGTSHAISATAGDMSNTHPMEFVYDAALATLDGELMDPTLAGSSTEVGGDGTIVEDMLSGIGKINCVSCHEIHVNGLHDGTAGTFTLDIPHLKDIPGIEYKLGWGGNAAVENDWDLSYRALCITCHIK